MHMMHITSIYINHINDVTSRCLLKLRLFFCNSLLSHHLGLYPQICVDCVQCHALPCACCACCSCCCKESFSCRRAGCFCSTSAFTHWHIRKTLLQTWKLFKTFQTCQTPTHVNCYINLHCKFWEAGEQKQQVSSNKCSTSHTNHFGHARSWPGELVFLLLILLHVSRPFVNMLVAICICKHKAGSNAHDAYHINIHQSYQWCHQQVPPQVASLFLQQSAEPPFGPLSANMCGLRVWISKLYDSMHVTCSLLISRMPRIVFPSNCLLFCVNTWCHALPCACCACCSCCCKESFSCRRAGCFCSTSAFTHWHIRKTLLQTWKLFKTFQTCQTPTHVNCYINLHCKFWEAGEQKQQVSSNKCSTSHANHFGHARSWPGELVFLLLTVLRVSRPFVNMLVAICICKHKAGSNAHDAYHINTHQSYQWCHQQVPPQVASLFLQQSAEPPFGPLSANMCGLCVWISKTLWFYACYMFSFDKPNAPDCFFPQIASFGGVNTVTSWVNCVCFMCLCVYIYIGAQAFTWMMPFGSGWQWLLRMSEKISIKEN